MTNYILHIFLSVFLFLGTAFAQENDIFIKLDERYGLLESKIYDIVEDSEGIIWISSENGLIKYDGFSFEYQHHEKQKNLGVFHFFNDSQGKIWFTNLANQLFFIEQGKINFFGDYYDQHRGAIFHIRHFNERLYLSSDISLTEIDLNKKKIIDQKRGTICIVPTVFNSGLVMGFENWQNSQVNSVELIKLLRSSEVSTITDVPVKANRISHSVVYEQQLLFYLTKGNENHFYILDKQNRVVSISHTVPNGRIISLKCKDKEILLCTENGLYICEIVGTQLKIKRHIFQQYIVTQQLTDKNGNQWISTLNDGVFVVPNSPIKQISVSEKNATIQRFFKGKDNQLFYATSDFQLYSIHPVFGEQKIPSAFENKSIQNLFYNPIQNQYLIHYESYGFNVFDEDFNKLSFHHDWASYKSIEFIGKDTVGIATNSYFSIRKLFDTKNKALFTEPNRAITCAYDSKANKIYFSTVQGLYQLDKNYQKSAIKLNNSTSYVSKIAISPSGLVGILTYLDGVYILKNGKVIDHYSKQNGLLSNINFDIKWGGNRLWIAGKKGVQHINLSNKKIVTFDKLDGIATHGITGFEVINDTAYVSNSQTIYQIPPHENLIQRKLIPYFKSVSTNNRNLDLTKENELSHNEKSLKIQFNTNGFLTKERIQYEYRVKEINSNWEAIPSGQNEVNFKSLPTGEFSFELRAKDTQTISPIIRLDFHRNKIFYNTLWFRTLVIIAVLFLAYSIYKARINAIFRKRDKEELQKRLAESSLTSLKAQMNPHFLFNAINSIQSLVLHKKQTEAYSYLTQLADLIRNNLNMSDVSFVTLQEELNLITQYLELEKLRFEDDFSYSINNSVEDVDLKIPSMIIQPFVENSIKHGLLHKETDRKVSVDFVLAGENIVVCTITDNGVGREASKEINQKKKHKSFSTQAIQKRFNILKEYYKLDIGYEFEDLYQENQAIGTKVTIRILVQNEYE